MAFYFIFYLFIYFALQWILLDSMLKFSFTNISALLYRQFNRPDKSIRILRGVSFVGPLLTNISTLLYRQLNKMRGAAADRIKASNFMGHAFVGPTNELLSSFFFQGSIRCDLLDAVTGS